MHDEGHAAPPARPESFLCVCALVQSATALRAPRREELSLEPSERLHWSPLPRVRSMSLLELAPEDQPLDPSGKTKLIAACEDKDVGRARSLLTSRASPDVANKDGQTPLYVACKAGCAELASMLLYARADISKANSSGFSPLYIASQKGNLECCTTLINAKANVDQAARNRSTPLLCARARLRALRLLALRRLAPSPPEPFARSRSTRACAALPRRLATRASCVRCCGRAQRWTRQRTTTRQR